MLFTQLDREARQELVLGEMIMGSLTDTWFQEGLVLQWKPLSLGSLKSNHADVAHDRSVQDNTESGAGEKTEQVLPSSIFCDSGILAFYFSERSHPQ